MEHPPGNTAPVAVMADPVCPAPGQPEPVERLPVRREELHRRERDDADVRSGTSATANTGTGPNPKRTYTAPGTYTVTLTATDEWGAVSAPVTKTVTIGEPAGNVAPNPVINLPNCAGLTCNFSAVGTVDPNTGDTITYLWNFGDPTTGVNNTRTGSSGSHVFSAPGELHRVAHGHRRMGQGDHDHQAGHGRRSQSVKSSAQPDSPD